MGRGKNRRPFILRQLKQFGEGVWSRPREQERKQEVRMRIDKIRAYVAFLKISGWVWS